MRDRKLILDEASSKPDEGILITQPYTFIKGSVVTVAVKSLRQHQSTETRN
jgi:hypothetical protein